MMTKTYKQLMDEARHTIPEVTVDEVKNRVERGEHWTLLDVREREEYREGHLEGALSLESAWRFFPMGSIHLAVIDPGVGSRRRPLGLRAGGHYFVGPDNGLFTFALLAGGWSAVSIEAPAYRLPEVSRTFHGRDIFAPTAAHLASGVPLERLGHTVTLQPSDTAA